MEKSDNLEGRTDLAIIIKEQPHN